jgi:hypothetical protein
LAWCFFRLSVFQESLICVEKWFVFDSSKMFSETILDPSLWVAMLAYGVMVLIVEMTSRMSAGTTGEERSAISGFGWGMRIGILLLAALLSPGGTAPAFIYFQF